MWLFTVLLLLWLTVWASDGLSWQRIAKSGIYRNIFVHFQSCGEHEKVVWDDKQHSALQPSMSTTYALFNYSITCRSLVAVTIFYSLKCTCFSLMLVASFLGGQAKRVRNALKDAKAWKRERITVTSILLACVARPAPCRDENTFYMLETLTGWTVDHPALKNCFHQYTHES